MSLDNAYLVGVAVLLCLFLAAGLFLVLKIIEHFQVKPPHHERYATKVELKQVEGRLDKIAEERRVSVANLHAKIDLTTGTTKEMQGELRMINQNLAALTADFSAWVRSQASTKK